MRDLPHHDPAVLAEVRASKVTIIGFTADGEPIWSRAPSPAQDAKWLARQRLQFDAAISCAKRLSKLSVQYFRWADEETSPSRAAHYAVEARRMRRNSWSHLRLAKGSYFHG